MTTIYEQSLQRLSEASGANIEIGEDRIANVVVEDRVLTLKPSDEAESALTAFTIVAKCDDSGRFSVDTLEKALAMDLFGARTLGGHIGLFADALFLSRTIAVEGLSPEALAEEFVLLVRLAEELERELDGADDDAQGGGEAVAPAPAPEDIPHLNFGLDGFMRV